MDVQAARSLDAAHLFAVEAKKERPVGLPKPTLAPVFEMVTGGKIYHVTGAALQRWIVEKHGAWKGLKGYLLIRVGPAGWKYKDWEGVVYPRYAPRAFNELAYIANYFTAVEANSSYNGHHSPERQNSNPSP